MLRTAFVICVTFGLALKDITGIPVQCESGKFLCDGTRCIRGNWRCDGDRDCADGSDEFDCDVECNGDRFLCDGTRCVRDIWRCDGYRDCADGSDEFDCDAPETATPSQDDTPNTQTEVPVQCESGKFLCDGTRCIRGTWRCDGERDCKDGSDEIDCGASETVTSSHDDTPNTQTEVPVQCESGKFLCDGTRCIRGTWRCDGDQDCADGSDEVDCDASETATSSQDDTPNTQTDTTPATTPAATPVSRTLCTPDNRMCISHSEGIPVECESGKFLCDNIRCLRDSWRCDGVQDCTDGKDEFDCGGTTPATTRAATPATRTIHSPDHRMCIDLLEGTHISTLLKTANRTSDGVHALTDGRYYLFFFELNWFQAVELCSQMNMSSATFNTEVDYNQLVALIRQKNGYDEEASYWTAGSDLGKRGKWVWHPLGRPLMYTRWGRGEPSDSESDNPKERCIEIKGAKGYTMNDCPCDIKYYVICENNK